jgi:hypothetical protein
MHEALQGLNGVDCICDDVLVHGSGNTVEEARADHDRNMLALLDRCREKGIRLNLEKLQLDRPRTVFMGHELTSAGLLPDRRKVAAILQMPAPTDCTGVLRLLGMATYLVKFCANFSEITAPIRQLLLKDTDFCWDDAIHGAALNKLKQLLTQPPVLCYYDVTKPIVVQCDSSQNAIGAVIMQDNKPVEYASRTMTRIERDSYAQIEKELLAVVFSLDRFDSYVYGRHITVETDHKPLITIAKKSLASAPKRLQRMLLRLQRYNFELVYRPGPQMLIADTLSRASSDVTDKHDKSKLYDELAALGDEAADDIKLVASHRLLI